MSARGAGRSRARRIELDWRLLRKRSRGGASLTFADVVGAVRRHKWIVATAVLFSFVVLGGFLFTRAETSEPTQWRTEVNFAVPSLHPDVEGTRSAAEGTASASEGVPRALIQGQQTMAQSIETRTAALRAAGLAPFTRGIQFSASLNETQTVMRLSVTAPDPEVSKNLAEHYADAVLAARRELVVAENNARHEDLVSSIDSLRTRTRALEQEIGAQGYPVPPVQRIDDEQQNDEQAAAAPTPLLDAPTGVALLVFERDVLYWEVVSRQVEAAEAAVRSASPSSYAESMGTSTPQRLVPETQSPFVPSAVIIIGGLVLGVGGAVVADRLDHTIRSTRSAARAFGAPLLTTVPSSRRRARYAVLQDPGSPPADAYLSLAATSVATDRLPKAIMVSSPRGDAHDALAGNFAAALAGLGLKVALVATSPRQDWYLDPFDVSENAPTFPELLARAHLGRLDGQVDVQLPQSTSLPGLAAVPAGDEPRLEVPLDGLPPLLEALDRADFDVTVIAGPALLEDPNATIVAWATGTVLWACQLGDSVTDDATLAATRLELAGVHPFGVAALGAEK